jgi:hypothetical protein
VHRRRARHALDATRDHHVLEAGEHTHRGEVDGLLARAAEAVERDAGRLDDQPASSAAMRAMSIEWSPLPAPQPITTSSTSAVSKPLRCCSALSTCARMRCGCTLCSAPVSLPLPRGERTASMIQASLMRRTVLPRTRAARSVAGAELGVGADAR